MMRSLTMWTWRFPWLNRSRDLEDELHRIEKFYAQDKQEFDARIQHLLSEHEKLQKAHREEQTLRKALEEELLECRNSNQNLRHRMDELDLPLWSNPPLLLSAHLQMMRNFFSTWGFFILWLNRSRALEDDLHRIQESSAQEKQELEARIQRLVSEHEKLMRVHREEQRLRKALEDDFSECRNSNQNLRRRMNDANATHNLGNSYSDSSATPTLFNTMVTRLREAALSFAKIFEPHVQSCQHPYTFAKRRHRQFAIASSVCRIIFTGFEIEDFGINEGYCTVVRDPAELRKQAFETYELFRDAQEQDIVNNDSSFAKFCSIKCSNLCTDATIVGDLQKAATELFLNLLKQIWLLHKVAFSFYPSPATVLRFSDGVPFDARFMESVSVDEDDGFIAEQAIGFMIIPGFRVRDQAFKSYVYPKLRKP